MKLIFCPDCHDVRRLDRRLRTCYCRRFMGRYTDDLNAEIAGKAIPLGIDNGSFADAIAERPDNGMGRPFTAFVIPRRCPTVKERKS